MVQVEGDFETFFGFLTPHPAGFAHLRHHRDQPRGSRFRTILSRNQPSPLVHRSFGTFRPRLVIDYEHPDIILTYNRHNPLLDHYGVMLGTLLNVLRSSPSLEDVHLVVGVLIPERGASHRPVPLPHLRKLFLCSNPTPVPLLISITLPPTACVVAQTHPNGLLSHHPMFQLDQHISPLISGSDELIFSVSEISALFTPYFKRDRETRIKFEYGLSRPVIRQTLTFVATCLLDAVRCFVIEGVWQGMDNDDVSRAIIQNLRNVETLVLRNTTHLLRLLLPTVRHDQPPCPTLKTIAIDDDQEIPDNDLVQAVKIRFKLGFPFQRIILRAEYFEQVAGELRQFVEEMEHGGAAEFRS